MTGRRRRARITSRPRERSWILLGIAIDRFILPGDVPGLIRVAVAMLVVYVGLVVFHKLQPRFSSAA